MRIVRFAKREAIRFDREWRTALLELDGGRILGSLELSTWYDRAKAGIQFAHDAGTPQAVAFASTKMRLCFTRLKCASNSDLTLLGSLPATSPGPFMQVTKIGTPLRFSNALTALSRSPCVERPRRRWRLKTWRRASPNSELQQTWASLRSGHAAEPCYAGQTHAPLQPARPAHRGTERHADARASVRKRALRRKFLTVVTGMRIASAFFMSKRPPHWMTHCLLLGIAVCACAPQHGAAHQSPGDAGSGGADTGDIPAVTSHAGDGGTSTGLDIRLVSHSRNGAELTVAWESSEPLRNIWDPSCGTAPRLLKQFGGSWTELQDDRPKQGTHQPYYLDGTYTPNSSLGCDGGNSCYDLPLRVESTVSTLEYVAIGTHRPPDPSTPDAGVEPIPDVISRDTDGPYQFELRYMLTCVSNDIQSVRLYIP